MYRRRRRRRRNKEKKRKGRRESYEKEKGKKKENGERNSLVYIRISAVQKGGGKPDEKDRFQHIMPDCVCIETSMMKTRIRRRDMTGRIASCSAAL